MVGYVYERELEGAWLMFDLLALKETEAYLTTLNLVGAGFAGVIVCVILGFVFIKLKREYLGNGLLVGAMVLIVLSVGATMITSYSPGMEATETNKERIQTFFEDEYVGSFEVKNIKSNFSSRPLSSVEAFEDYKVEVTVDEGFFTYELISDEDGTPALGRLIDSAPAEDAPELVKKEDK